ncbi:hypothetical protein XENTR_v10022944 [Xenopus tropicalis]|uniref:Uncharacterized protein n=1 Tax=Xenopus tropicalis TaxID=8364 RepID=A0A1B8XU00_XENTR|nr:hypothetical protein XENTR_v10022944 [Xenopus tropicalis]
MDLVVPGWHYRGHLPARHSIVSIYMGRTYINMDVYEPIGVQAPPQADTTEISPLTFCLLFIFLAGLSSVGPSFISSLCKTIFTLKSICLKYIFKLFIVKICRIWF